MSDDIYDMLQDLAANAPGKSKPKPAPVEEQKPKPKSRTKKRGDEEEMDDVDYRTVPKTSTFPTCGTCRTKLKPGEKHWYYIADGDRYWWCTKCMKTHCNTYPPGEEPRGKHDS